MSNVLYLPSTPLNVFVSAALALHHQTQDKAELWLIDQRQSKEENLYFHALNNWTLSPFQNVRLWTSNSKGWAKLGERHQTFAQMSQALSSFVPEKIAVGSDRRVEFQYAMHCLTDLRHPVEGWYLDDGLYTYAGHYRSKLAHYVNALSKKIAYGNWWQEPITIGASHWIHRLFLFRPQYAIADLAEKPSMALESQLLQQLALQSFSVSLCELLDYDVTSLTDVDLIMILPHPHDRAKMQDYDQKVRDFIVQASARGHRVAVKYHPREVGVDPLLLQAAGASQLIPASLAFEFVLPFLKAGTQIVADVCTVLFTAKWLRDDLEVMAILNPSDPYQCTFLPLMRSLKMPTLNHFQQILDKDK